MGCKGETTDLKIPLKEIGEGTDNVPRAKSAASVWIQGQGKCLTGIIFHYLSGPCPFLFFGKRNQKFDKLEILCLNTSVGWFGRTPAQHWGLSQTAMPFR